MRAGEIRSGLGAVSAATALGTLLAFGAALRALEPVGISTTFSLLRFAIQGLVCFAGATAIAWACAARALADLGAADRDASEGLDCARLAPGRFAAGAFGVWMLCAVVGILVEPHDAAHSLPAERLIAFAVLGLAAAAANLLLAARVMAPVAEALAQRTPLTSRARMARPFPLAWTLRLLVTSLVLVPVVLDALVAQSRARDAAPALGALGSPLAVSLIALAIGLVLAELASAHVRRGAASLRDAARNAVRGTREGLAGSGEFSEVFEALEAVSRSIQDALDAFAGAAA